MNDYKVLSNGVKIPLVGFGVFRTGNEETVDAVKWAIEAGYRHIDTAHIYGNEEGVGKGIIESGIAREDIFVTTKLWNADVRSGTVREGLEESLRRLQLDYVDLYLIHWPADGRNEAWAVIEEMYKEGKMRAIGLSNFHQYHYEELMQTAKIKPMIIQIESNPIFNNGELIEFYEKEGIVAEAWSPLGGNGACVLDNEVIIEIAKKYEKSPAQVAIRWQMQRGVVVLPKSSHKERIEQNFDVFDFELSQEDMDAINAMNTNQRLGGDPDNFDF